VALASLAIDHRSSSHQSRIPERCGGSAVRRYTANMAMIATQYERPSSVKLAGVKHELYHPRLPTLRRMDIDTTAHRLSTEHARTTTTCSRGTFTSVRVISLTLFFAYKKGLCCSIQKMIPCVVWQQHFHWP